MQRHPTPPTRWFRLASGARWRLDALRPDSAYVLMTAYTHCIYCIRIVGDPRRLYRRLIGTPVAGASDSAMARAGARFEIPRSISFNRICLHINSVSISYQFRIDSGTPVPGASDSAMARAGALTRYASFVERTFQDFPTSIDLLDSVCVLMSVYVLMTAYSAIHWLQYVYSAIRCHQHVNTYQALLTVRWRAPVL